MNTRTARFASLAAALVTCTLATSCLINSDSKTSVSGRYISAETLATIEPGKSSDYVAAVLGEPTTRTTLNDGTEIWKWCHTKTTSSETAVIFLVASDNDTTTEHTTYVELKDGVVVKTWRD